MWLQLLLIHKYSNEYYRNVHSSSPTLVLEKQKNFYEAIFYLKIRTPSYFQYDDICNHRNVIYYNIILS